MSESQGHVVTFYSFKGGTGRTMALANVAWILAANGKRVLVADWDLESPGLHRFFRPYLDQDSIKATGGIIDMIRRFEWHAGANERSDGTPIEKAPGWHADFAKIALYAQSIQWPFPDRGTLDFLGAGRQNRDYATTLGAMDWETFYDKLHGSEFFAALRNDMKRNYDYTLIDSRTGLSDVADICTFRLPDTLVDCFTLSEQGIEGAASVAATIATRYSDKRDIRILPVPMRIDPAEKEKADAGKALAKRRFPGLPAGMSPDERTAYWAQVEVPYQAFYAYEETLATFGDAPGSAMLTAFERLTSYITNGQIASLPPIEEPVRLREMEKFRRRMDVGDHEVMLWYTPEDEVWAEWIESLLNASNVRVSDPGSPPAHGVRTMAILSSRTDPQTVPSAKVEDLIAVYVSDMKPLAGLKLEQSVFISGTPAKSAIEKVLRLLGLAPGQSLVVNARYPGTEPLHFNPPARNPRFTGRDLELRSLRSQLRSGGGPVVLQGTSGYGKTQIALEYAHRYRSAYDIIWWIASEQPELLDSHLTDLAERLGQSGGTGVEDSAAVLNALSRGEPSNRWLLIYDSADDIERVSSLLPKGGLGHIIITSIDPGWIARARFIDVPVFRRDESVTHLRRRLATITETQAEHVAEVFGDLPFAISNAEAWLVETGTPIPDYLRQIESSPATTIDAAFNQWRLSLNTLKSTSPGAHRLIQLCATLAGETALELIYSDEMAGALTTFDPTVRDRIMIGKLVQDLNRLALIKLDPLRGQMHIHLLLRRLIRESMPAAELQDARHQMHLVLAESRPRRGGVDDPETWSRFRLLWPHLIESGAVDCPDEKVRQLLVDRVRYLNLQGDLSQGETLGRRIVASWTAALAGSGTDVALTIQLLQLRFNLANILRFQGKFDEARQIDMEVLDAQRELLGPDHADSLMTSGSLAGDLRGLGRYQEALNMDMATYQTWLDLMGEDNTRTLIAGNNLATAYRLVGDYRSAREHDQRVYDKRRRVNPVHPYTFASGSNLGRDHRDAGEYDRSVSLLRNIYEGIAAELGPDDIRTVVIQANYAVSLRAAGRAAEAMPILEATYRQIERLRGESDPETLACRLSRAVNMLAVGREREADVEMLAVIDAYAAKYGPEHPHTLVCESSRSAVLRALRDPEAARDLAQHAAERLSAILSADHPFTIGARMNQAICLAELGELDEARILTEDAAARLTETLGTEHPDTLRAQANLALIHRTKDPTPVTEEAVAQTIRRLVKATSGAHPTVLALGENRYAHRIIEPHPF